MLTGIAIDSCLTIRRLYTFFERVFEPGFFFKGESHDFYEVVCCLGGEIGITAGKEIFTMHRGEMTIHPPGEFHAIRREGADESRAIIFSFGATHFPAVIGKVFDIGEDGIKSILDIFDKINLMYENEHGQLTRLHQGKEINAALTVKELEIFLIRYLSCGNNIKEAGSYGSSQLFARILSVMEDGIGDSLTVDEMADACGVSVPTLEKTVNKYLSCGAINHYNALRMQRAQNLLIKGMSVGEVAEELRYSSQNYFSARFSKYYGYSPSSVKRRK